jgi:Carboxypeptidase regulatory-like domain
MDPTTSQRKPSRRLLWAALVVLSAALLGVALFLALRPREGGAAAQAAATGRAAKQRHYRNRALWPRPAAADEGASGEEKKPAITGYVYGMDGSALPGATIAAMTFEVAGNVLSTVATVRSDERGRFEIGLVEGIYQLSATLEGHGGTSAGAHTGDMVSLVLPKSGVIEGHVRDEQGKPVRRFAIDVLSAVGSDNPAAPPLFSRTFESEDGSFRVDQLPSWEIVVRATASDHAPAFSPSLIVRPTDAEKMDFTLSKGCVLTGQVVDSSGAPQPHVYLDAESLLVAGEVSDLSLEAAAQTESEMDGSFTLSNVPKGTVVVRGYDGASAVSTVNVEISDCAKVEPVKLVMSPGGGISGVARSAYGEPIVGARLTLMHRPIGFVNTVSDDEGRFHFEQIPAGTMRLMMTQDDRVTVLGVQVEEGKTSEINISSSSGGTGALHGRVTAGDKPLPFMRLMVATSNPQDGSVGLYYPVTAGDGSYSVPSLPAGVYIVNIISTNTGSGVNIKPDEVTTLDLRVEPLPPAQARSEKPAPQR